MYRFFVLMKCRLLILSITADVSDASLEWQIIMKKTTAESNKVYNTVSE